MALIPKKYKKSKIKQRRRRVAVGIVIILFLLICYATFRSRDYEKIYNVKDFSVKEHYKKNLQVYTFEITKDNQTWHLLIEHKYLTKHKLINNIEVIHEEDTTCIIPESEQLTLYPQCIKDENLIDYRLISDSLQRKINAKYFLEQSYTKKTYEKIDIKNIDNNTYYVWNYKGFYQIQKDSQSLIELFSKDIYDISNTTKIGDYIVIPDYNESYYFNKFYLLQMSNGKINTWEFKDSIYFDGYYLGSEKNSLYYVDRKNKIEWELVPKKKKMRKVGTENKEGRILKNTEWERISLTKLINETLKFEKEESYHYEINEGLYVSYLDCNAKKKISNQNVKEIVAQIKDKVYYLVEDSLYYYSETTGEVEIMSYFEWNFNYQNMIFIKEN